MVVVLVMVMVVVVVIVLGRTHRSILNIAPMYSDSVHWIPR